MALRTALLGTPTFAVSTLEAMLASSHEVVGVITQPDRPSGRGRLVHPTPVKAAALAHDLPILQPERLRPPEVAQAVDAWNLDVGVVAAYGKIIPSGLLALPRLGMINVHASLLPRYRGAAPVHRAVIDGETVTGVTIMRVVPELDAGPALARAERPIGPHETSEEVERDLAASGADLLIRVLEQLAAGTAVEQPQDDAHATYAPRLTKADGLVDWSLSSSAIHNRVRGLYPWPHAYTFLDGRRLVLLRTHVEADGHDGEPGTVIEVAPGRWVVTTGHGGRVGIDRLQPEGRRAMSARAFFAGHPVTHGARFTGP